MSPPMPPEPSSTCSPVAARRRGMRLTRDGMAAAVFSVALVAVAYASGNNLLYLLASLAGALWMVSWAAGRANLQDLRVGRQLPHEAFARRPARGTFTIHGPRRWPASFDLRVEDGATRAFLESVPRGERVTLDVGWRFARRGRAVVQTVRLWSKFPFGWAEWWSLHELPDEMWVYPEPSRPGEARDLHGLGRDTTTREPEELTDLRPYRLGDAMRDIHWPTSARVGEPIVRIRQGRAAAPVWIDVPELRGDELEDELKRASATVLDAHTAGRPIGLRVGGHVMPPRHGSDWRRRILEVLASLPAVP